MLFKSYINFLQEELIELVELTSPRKSKSLIKNNTIETSPINTATYSLSSASDDADIINIFSVNNASGKQKNEGATSERRTISEISDDIFLVKHEVNTTRTGLHKPYKQKIAEHLKKIRDKASTPSREHYSKARGKIPVEKIRRESENMNAEVEMVRSKFNLKNTAILQQEKENFFNFSLEFTDKVMFFLFNYINLTDSLHCIFLIKTE